MGQTLSEPIVLKDSSAGVDQRLMYGASAMQGWRVTMEDAHTTIMNLEEELPFGTNTGAGRRVEPGHAFFAVYDGHGGSRVAQYSGKNLHRVLVKHPLFVAHEYEKAIRAVFLQMDQNLREDPEYKEEASGCTAVMVLLTPDNELYCGNAGDSRGVLSRAGTAVPLSYDHKPTNPKETERIHNAGGFVEYGRVNGNLALSRAMGDFEFKNNARLPPEEQTVTAAPDVTRTQLTFPDDEFIILACDGIWDCMTSQAAVEWVSLMIANGAELHAICETMMNGCVAPLNYSVGAIGSDNMTIVIIALLNGRSEQVWRESVKARVTANGLSVQAQLDAFFVRNPSHRPKPMYLASNGRMGRDGDDGDDAADAAHEARNHGGQGAAASESVPSPMPMRIAYAADEHPPAVSEDP